MTDQIEQILSISDVAKRAGWTYRRALRRLRRIDEESGGKVLTKLGTSRTSPLMVRWSALQTAKPSLFVDAVDLDRRVSSIERRVALIEDAEAAFLEAAYRVKSALKTIIDGDRK
jgi:hypothetical protein